MAEIGFYMLASLIGTGYLLRNSPKEQRAEQHSAQRLTAHNDETVGQNVLHSTDFQRHTATEAATVSAQAAAARDPAQSNIVPMYYNTLQVQQDAEKVPNTRFNKALVRNVVNYLDATTRQMLESASAGKGKGGGEWGISMDRARVKQEPEEALQQIGGSLRGDGTEDFTHNNMVPHYRGDSITQDTRADNRMKASKLETFTGQFKLNKPNRTELGQFFKPVQGLTNVNGWDGQGATRDMSRYNPNNTGRKQGERPFEQINVGPGLNAGKFTAEPSGGFHDRVRIMPKDITQLRVDPVLEAEGRINHGASHVQNRTATSNMYRNRPELLVTNFNGERNFTTVGAVSGRRLRSKPVDRATNRQDTTRSFFGTALADVKKRATDVDAKVTESLRQNFFNTPFRNTAGYNSKRRATDYGKSSFKARPNNRSERPSSNHMFGAVQQSGGRQAGPAYEPKEWQARVTIRETTEDSNHMGNVGPVQRKHIVYDPEDKARTTIRETTEDNHHIGNVDRGVVQGGNGYTATNVEAPNTNRQFTSDNEHYGGASSQNSRMRKYDDAYNARTNTNKEVVAQGRAPTNSGPSLGPQPVNVELRRIDDDRRTRHAHVKTSTVGNMFNPNAVTACTNTSQRNHLPQTDTRLDTAMVDAFKANPLTQSLNSYA